VLLVCEAEPHSQAGARHGAPGLTGTQPGQKPDTIIESNTGANRSTLTQEYQPSWQPLP
jgi:hypothetical protein